MKNFKLIIIIIACANIFAACKKDKTEPIELSKLPPTTQTGANTFGCLVNGKVWIPKGYNGSGTPNPHIIYSTGLNGIPYLSIDTRLYENNNSAGEIYISIGNLDHIGFYFTPTDFRFSAGWTSVLGNCGMTTLDSTVQSWGGGVITKLDIPNQIIAGTFSFKAKRPNCDTLFISDGRFDIKF